MAVTQGIVRPRAAWLTSLVAELKAAARRLSRQPGFSVPVVLTLGIAIAVCASVFALVDIVLLRPLPLPAAARLVFIQTLVPGVQRSEHWGLAAHEYYYFRRASKTLEDLAVYREAELNVRASTQAMADRTSSALVSANVFEMIGARPQLGRLFNADDNAFSHFAVVLGNDYWKGHYGGTGGVIGKQILIEGSAATIVGVLPPGSTLPGARIDIWLPLGLDSAAAPINQHDLSAIGRLRSGASLEVAQADLNRLTQNLPRLFPTVYPKTFWEKTGFSTRVIPLQEKVVGRTAAVALFVVLCAAAGLLLIAAANVLNLQLVRLERRRAELAVRVALGLGRSRLAGHFIAETLMLCLAAAVLASAVTPLLVVLLRHASPSAVSRLNDGGSATPAIYFIACASILLGVCLGLVPVLRRYSVDATALRSGGRGLAGAGGRQRLRNALVAAQVAVSIVLLAAAGLLARSFNNLRHVDAGFVEQRVLAITIMPPVLLYQRPAQISDLYERIAREVGAIPGVAAAGVGQYAPLDPRVENGWCQVVHPEGMPEGDEPPCVAAMQVSPGYLMALGIAVHGQIPGWAETDAASAGVVISRSLAKRLWPDASPIGRGLRPLAGRSPFYRVVGIANDTHANGLDQPVTEAAYFPLRAAPSAPLWSPQEMTLVVRSRPNNGSALLAAIRRTISMIDPGVALGTVEPMSVLVARSTARQAFAMRLSMLSAVVALFLSFIGLYAVLAFFVGERRREIGIRMALGATVGDVRRLVVGHSMRLVGIGALAGLVFASVSGRSLSALLFDVSPVDASTLCVVTCLLMVVALFATVLPTWTATSVDPAEVLRNE